MKKQKRLGDMLIEEGIINQLQLVRALEHQRKWGGKLGSILVNLGFLTEKDIATVLENQLKIKCVNLSEVGISQAAIQAVRPDIARRFCIMPIEFDGRSITIATLDPTDLKTLDTIGFALGRSIKPVLALDSDIKSAIEKYYTSSTLAAPREEAPIAPSVPRIAPSQGATATASLQQQAPMPTRTSSRPDPSMAAVVKRIDALVMVLVEKGVITREELIRKITSTSDESLF